MARANSAYRIVLDVGVDPSIDIFLTEQVYERLHVIAYRAMLDVPKELVQLAVLDLVGVAGGSDALVARGAWSSDALEAEVRNYVVEHLGNLGGC